MRNKINNSFVNLEELVYTPMRAIAKSNALLGRSIIDMIADTGDINPEDETDTIHLKTINMAYEQINNDRVSGKVIENVGLKVPLISVIPISNLQVKRSKISFDVEVKGARHSKEESHCSIEARICSSAKQRRVNDCLPKVAFEIEMESSAPPEGLSRFVDLLNVNPIPEILSKKYLNDKGEVLTGEGADYYKKIDDLHLQEIKLGAMGEEISNIIASKKLMFNKMPTLINKQSTFDTLFNDTDEDENLRRLEEVVGNNGDAQEIKILYEEIRDYINTYKQVMNKTCDISEQIVKTELSYIKERLGDE